MIKPEMIIKASQGTAVWWRGSRKDISGMPVFVSAVSPREPHQTYVCGIAFDEKTNTCIMVNTCVSNTTKPLDTTFDKLGWPLAASFKLFQMSLGSDPECFVGDKKGGIIPAWKVFPEHETDRTEKPYWDGFQAEFKVRMNTCCGYFLDSFQAGLKAVREAGPIVLDSVVEIPHTTLSKVSEKHYRLGCNPSMNAYGRMGQVVMDGRELPFRFAGMHMHFGTEKFAGNNENCNNGTKALDAILGLVLTAIGGRDENPIRRVYYGLPGEYRMPKHGLEYRVPAAWTMKHPGLVHLSFDLGRFALGLQLLGLFKKHWDADEDEVCTIITNSDFKAALNVLNRKKNKATLTEFLDSAYVKQDNVEMMLGAGNVNLPVSKQLNLETAQETFAKILDGTVEFCKDKLDHYWHLDGTLWTNHSESPTCNMFKILQAKGVLA